MIIDKLKYESILDLGCNDFTFLKNFLGKSKTILDYLYHNQDYPVGLCIDPVTAFSDCIKGSRYGGNGNCYIVIFRYREIQPSLEKQLTTARLRIENLLAENLKLKHCLKNNPLLVAMEIRIRELEDVINSIYKEVNVKKDESCVKKVRFI
jgi:hypothetical protein